MHQVAVLGAGAFGTALAVQFARAGCASRLWARDPAQAALLRTAGSNADYLPGVAFPPEMSVSAALESTLAGADFAVCAVPAQATRDTFKRIAALPACPDPEVALPVVWVSKGLELASGRLLHEVAREEFGPERPVGAISGPNFAAEIGAGLPGATSVAATSVALAERVVAALHGNYFRPYLCTDLVGLEVGGALKNIIAIAAGVVDGMAFGANARAALITRGLAEMARFGVALGADSTTFMGLSGVGDLILTATDNQSRNRRFGLALGEGASVEEALARVGDTVEGVATAQAVVLRAAELGVELPIIEQVSRLVRGETDARMAAQELMARELARE